MKIEEHERATLVCSLDDIHDGTPIRINGEYYMKTSMTKTDSEGSAIYCIHLASGEMVSFHEFAKVSPIQAKVVIE